MGSGISMPLVLVVDDTEEIRRLVKFSLKAAGIESAEASSGPEALFAVETLRPDVMVLDVMMPQMDGYEVLREMKRRFPDIDLPTILLTAKTELSDKAEGFEAGAQDYLTKPFAPQELVMRVKAQIRAKQEREKLRIAARGLEELSATDELTGVYNRRHLMQRLKEAFAEVERYHHPLSLMLFDIDHFKQINDTYGHSAGDDVLRALPGIIKPKVRQEDIMARYGGEEFVLLLPNTTCTAAVELADRVREMVASHTFTCGSQKLHITISIGVAGLPVDEVATPEEMLDIADKRLYVAKHLGRNRVIGREKSAASAA